MLVEKCPQHRWAWVEIDRGALRRNTRAFKNLLRPGQHLCCVVKADAYGHGALECAKVMHSTGADMFAVATVDEGVELRTGGYHHANPRAQRAAARSHSNAFGVSHHAFGIHHGVCFGLW